MKYTIYTDGAYSMQHNEGAFAYVILNSVNTEVERKAYKITNETNNRAELKAIIAAVNKLPHDATEVLIYSDSQYALMTLSGNWKHKNNHDLFETWDKVINKRPDMIIFFEWVKGHNGNVYNELCDQLCNDVLGYDANKEFEKFKNKKEVKRVQEGFAWKIYNFMNEWKSGDYGTIPLQDALDRYF